MTPPSSTFTDDRHTYVYDECQIVFERFSEDRDGTIKCEVTITTSVLDKGRISGPTRLNLLSDRSIKMLANTCGTRVNQVDWYAALSTCCALSVERQRDGDPLHAHTTQSDTSRRWLLTPFLEDGGWTVLYAEKGSAKSYLALSIALSIASGVPVFGTEPTTVGPVAYLDWEGSRREFDVRLTKLRRGMKIETEPPIYYRFGEHSLYSSTPGLQRRFTELGIVACVVDSKSVAMSGAPMGEAVLEINRAIRRLGVPTLLIDHKSKAAIKGDDPDMAIGSVHTGNAARLVFSVKAAYEDGEIRQHIICTDANNGPRSHPLDVTFMFEGDTTHVLCGGMPAMAEAQQELPAPY